jgi:hypothetical protein
MAASGENSTAIDTLAVWRAISEKAGGRARLVWPHLAKLQCWRAFAGGAARFGGAAELSKNNNCRVS